MITIKRHHGKNLLLTTTNCSDLRYIPFVIILLYGSFGVAQAQDTAITTPYQTYQIQLSPNPTSALVNISHTQPIQRITIRSVTGQLLQEYLFHDQKRSHILNLRFLKRGTYFIQVESLSGIKTKKLIKT